MSFTDEWQKFLKDVGGEPESWLHKCPNGTCPEVLIALMEKFGYNPKKKNPYIPRGYNGERTLKFLKNPSNWKYKDTNTPYPKEMWTAQRPLGSPRYIVLHSTQTPNVGQTIKSFLKSKSGERKSSHYEVSEDGITLEYIPPDLMAGHAMTANARSVGVDLTNPSPNPPAGSWSSQHIDGIKKLINYLTKRFNIPKVIAPYDFKQILFELKGLDNIKAHASKEEWELVKSAWFCEKRKLPPCKDGELIKAKRHALKYGPAESGKYEGKTAEEIKTTWRSLVKSLDVRRRRAKRDFKVTEEDIIKNGIGIVPHHVFATGAGKACPGRAFPYEEIGEMWQGGVETGEFVSFEEEDWEEMMSDEEEMIADPGIKNIGP